MSDASVADKVSDIVRSSAPESAPLIVSEKLMVVYTAAGSDHATAVKTASRRCSRVAGAAARTAPAAPTGARGSR